MIKLKISFLTVLLSIFCFSLNAQSEVKEYSIAEGQVFDIIFLTNRTEPEIKPLFQDYFKRASPIAESYGYHSLGGFGITENTLGNYLPDVMAIGYWETLDGRTKFLKAVETQMPDFHEMRRKIWPTFDLTYYEFVKDLTFSINKERFNTVTAYWAKDEQGFEEFKQSWLKQAKKAGGQTKIEFTNGQSPFGYHYNPDFLVITEWESKESFEAFHSQNTSMDHSALEHVNQFVLK